MAENSNAGYTLSGRILDRRGKPLADLTVRAFDQDPNTPDNPLGDQAVTDAKGRYKITFTAKDFKVGGGESGGPDIFIRVFYRDEVVGQSDVKRNSKQETTIDLRLDVEENAKPYSVSGTIRQSDGRGLADTMVRAIDKGLRDRRVLGETKTGADGGYRIGYDNEQLLDPKRRSANLVIEVIGPADDVLAESDVRFNARARETVNLRADADACRCELERLDARVLPALGDIPLAELSDDDVGFLEKSTRFPAKQLKTRRQAAQAAARSDLPEWLHYALIREGLPGDMDDLLETAWPRLQTALNAAVKANIVSAPEDKEAERIRQRFDELQTEHALDKPLRGELKVRQVLEVSGLEWNDQRRVATALVKTDFQSFDAWTTLQKKSGANDETMRRVEFAVRSAELTDGHLPTMKALHGNEQIHSVRDLAKYFGENDWRRLLDETIQDGEDDILRDMPGDSSSERRENLARRIYARVSEEYPDVSVIYGLSRNENLKERPATRWLPRMLEADEGFDLGRARIDAYVRERKEKLGVKSEEEERTLRDDLKRVQRVFRLRAEPAAVSQLLEDGLDSSIAILNRGRERFVATYGNEQRLGSDVAKAIYDRAERTAAAALGFYAAFSPTIQTTHTPAAVAGECSPRLQGVPNFTNLFGSLDGCECEPCESVYSPAAYLTDLLAFIESHVGPDPEADDADDLPSNGIEAIKTRSFCNRNDKLVSEVLRRPDLLDIKLSCRNAETLVPYVDLVLEILENAASPQSSGVPQTTLTATQLAAQPEHFIEGAYLNLRNAVFPFGLPFDLWHEESTIYLERLGTDPAELLETFFPFAGDDDPHDLTEIRRWQDKSIAAASLGLTEAEWKLISNQSPSNLHKAWGYESESGGDWWHDLRMADVLLERTGLQYNDLLRLLTLESFNPQRAIKLNPVDLNDCDPKKIRISGLNEHALGFLHRFVRLQRALGWTMIELDQALIHLKPGIHEGRAELNEDFLVRLAHFLRLRERFGLPLTEILSWWSELDTADYNADFLPPHFPKTESLYELLFLSGRPGEPQFDAFQLNSARTDLAVASQSASPSIAEHLDVVAAAVQLSQSDLNRLIDAVTSESDRKLSLATLSLLFRHASLARCLGLSIVDYVALKNLVAFDPFVIHDELDKTLQTLRFVGRAEVLNNSPFSVVELDYLLRQTPPFSTGETVAPAAEWIQQSLEAMGQALSSLDGFDPPRAALRDVMDDLGPGPGTSATTEDLRPKIEAVLAEVTGLGPVDADNALASILQAALALVQPGSTVDFPALHNKLLEVDLIIAGRMTETLAVELGEVLALPAATCGVLLNHVHSPHDSSDTAGETLLDALKPLPVGEDTDSPTEDELAALMLRLHKASLAVNKLHISHTELSWMLLRGEDIGWLDLKALPVQSMDPPSDFDTWARLVKLIGFRDRLPVEQQDHLFELFELADSADANQLAQSYIAKLTELTGWDGAKLNALIESDGGIVAPQSPGGFRDERLPLRLNEAVALLKRLGVTASEASSWISPPQNPTEQTQQVLRIKNALTHRYESSWSTVAKQFRDPLRERQRAALVAYLMHNWQLERADDLYDHFLIDVEMTACMMTSRIIQAAASVQMFVQRVLMNLEPGLGMSDEASEQWQWMKNYRVWEANRKVFLYPENWIEPELRDDKTPFFEDLENELMQADINNETAETALLHYLEKLHNVARLQVCGQYLEFDNPVVLHVFARTRDVPHHYYYRRGILEIDEDIVTSVAEDRSLEGAFAANWTAWERVDVNIEGDHLIPIVYNRRLYLFWPIFTEEDESPFENIDKAINNFIRMGMTLHQSLFKATLGVGNMALLGANEIIGGIRGLLEMVQDAANGVINALTFWNADDDSSGSPNTVSESGVVLTSVTDQLMSFSELIEQFASVDSTNGETDGGILGLFGEFSEKLNDVTSTLILLLPAKRLEVQLCWSEYKNDIWSEKTTSTGRVTYRDIITPILESVPAIPGAGKPSAKRMFTFQGEVDYKNQLRIRCRIGLPGDENCSALANQTVLVPNEVGYFLLNSCNGRVRAVDLPEDENLAEIVGTFLNDLTTNVQQQINQALDELHGVPQFQTGEPVTPDNDPLRPSKLRCKMEAVPLPHHNYKVTSLLTNNEIVVDDTYQIVARHQGSYFHGQDLMEWLKPLGFFYQDSKRSFFCFPFPLPNNNTGKPSYPSNPAHGIQPSQENRTGFVFFPFYHPYSCALLENIRRFGIPGLYDVRFKMNANGPEPDSGGQPLQVILKDEQYFQPYEYEPIDKVYNPPEGGYNVFRPIEEINFSTIGAYSQYNWEIFFHIPLLIASRLSTDQKFRQAQHWFHFIFNPTDASRGAAPAKYWRTRPFVESSDQRYTEQQIDELLQTLSAEAETPGLQELEWAVRQWRQNAFNPHLVARTRTVAFQKAVVMKYIDNLIAWGDSLFRRETREAVNEATQLYILAAKLLGPRPRRIPKLTRRPELSYNELPELDAFSNSLVEIESLLPAAGSALNRGSRVHIAASRGPLHGASMSRVDSGYLSLLKSRSIQDITLRKERKGDQSLYFCVPPNPELLDKWDVTADRLFKIRHCQNIKGEVLQLPLLSPPIDPAILVRTKAMGVDIHDVLGQLYAPLPHFRFQVLAQKATELCGDVKSLGSALLSALEKRDGEQLALLRNTHEQRVLESVQAVKEHQIDESKLALENLQRSQEATTLRRSHYQRLLIEFMNPEETANTALGAASLILQIAQFGLKFGSAAASFVPNIKGGFVTTLGVTYGGQNVGDGAERAADAFGHLSSILSSTGGLISTMGGYRRRAEDWLLQIQLAEKELEGMAKQIAAAEIRVAIAESDLASHKLQIQNSKDTNEFMQQKFTSKELYDWMVSHISTLYFQSYQLAYDVARRAERCFRYELVGLADSKFIQKYGYWDSLKKGLLAGERLHHDLKRMEVDYLEQNQREYEITKHVSLAVHDPIELLVLKQTGECFVRLPEPIFDVDYPGHYMRRIKSVSLTIPCVTGPYMGVNCKLTLEKSSVRHSAALDGDPYARQDDDTRFTDGVGGVQSIVTSSGQSDSGLFETNLRDERYLPFEGVGALSQWRLELPGDFPPFDYNTISDVVLHIRYTARDGGEELQNKAAEELPAELNKLFGATRLGGDDDDTGLVQMFSAKRGFSNQWHDFFNPPAEAPAQEFRLPLDKQSFPYLYHRRDLSVQGIVVLLLLDHPEIYTGGLDIGVQAAGGPLQTQTFQPLPLLQNQPYARVDSNFSANGDSNEVLLQIGESDLDSAPPKLVVERHGIRRLAVDHVQDIVVLVNYRTVQEVRQSNCR